MNAARTDSPMLACNSLGRSPKVVFGTIAWTSRSIAFGMKLYERREDMQAIARIRRPKAIHTMDQIVGQALATFRRMDEKQGKERLRPAAVAAE